MALPANPMESLRRELRQCPEPSGREERTAARLRDFLAQHRPSQLITGLGGCGLVAVFASPEPGPTVVLRAELDAVPAPGGAAHLCGHDGHMAALAGLAPWLAANREFRGRAALLFQPAEETGRGAASVLADPRYAALEPDYVFALHNLPGEPLGRVLLRQGASNCASEGLAVRLQGAASHAAHPEKGLSPAPALARLLQKLPSLGDEASAWALVTVVHARLGRPALGVSPGEAEIMATLRAEDDQTLAALRDRAEALVAQTAEKWGLGWTLEQREPFAAVTNHPRAAAAVRRAAEELGMEVVAPPRPFSWSEDFGLLAGRAPGALFCLGAGRETPPLHSAGYEFPDRLLEPARRLWIRILQNLLGPAAKKI